MIRVEVVQYDRSVRVRPERLRHLTRAVCSRFCARDVAVTLVVLDDLEMKALNRRYMGRRRTTDCFSFDLSDPGSRTRTWEILVNGERAAKQAQMRGHRPLAELALYITHGLLHQLGFDDTTSAQAWRMHQTEDRVLTDLGYGPVYGSSRAGSRGRA